MGFGEVDFFCLGGGEAASAFGGPLPLHFGVVDFVFLEGGEVAVALGGTPPLDFGDGDFVFLDGGEVTLPGKNRSCRIDGICAAVFLFLVGESSMCADPYDSFPDPSSF